MLLVRRPVWAHSDGQGFFYSFGQLDVRCLHFSPIRLIYFRECTRDSRGRPPVVFVLAATQTSSAHGNALAIGFKIFAHSSPSRQKTHLSHRYFLLLIVSRCPVRGSGKCGCCPMHHPTCSVGTVGSTILAPHFRLLAIMPTIGSWSESSKAGRRGWAWWTGRLIVKRAPRKIVYVRLSPLPKYGVLSNIQLLSFLPSALATTVIALECPHATMAEGSTHLGA